MGLYVFVLHGGNHTAYTYVRRTEAVDTYLYTHRRRKIDPRMHSELSQISTFPINPALFDMRMRRYGDNTALLVAHKAMALAYAGHVVKEASLPRLRNAPNNAQALLELSKVVPGNIDRIVTIHLSEIPWRSRSERRNEFYISARSRGHAVPWLLYTEDDVIRIQDEQASSISQMRIAMSDQRCQDADDATGLRANGFSLDSMNYFVLLAASEVRDTQPDLASQVMGLFALADNDDSEDTAENEPDDDTPRDATDSDAGLDPEARAWVQRFRQHEHLLAQLPHLATASHEPDINVSHDESVSLDRNGYPRRQRTTQNTRRQDSVQRSQGGSSVDDGWWYLDEAF